ncbi:MAG: carboxylating nicotinate-nucleotide diphosphorylase [Firmicutes bacterium]|nr:carboxylating nicotinate-nucleotide diphosphorylase [Bacillota bacterium]
MSLNWRAVRPIIELALAEDIGTGDVTTAATVPAEAKTTAFIHAKSPCVLAGNDVARWVFEYLDPNIQYAERKRDGDFLAPGEVIAELAGSARAILTGERVALNFLQRLSGIATRTARYVELVRPYPAKIVDTRKTTPGLRLLEKYAVTVGGGTNHRFGLYDAVLIKDNHIKMAGGIAEAIAAARKNIPFTMRVEIEVETLEQFKVALTAGPDIIMLDNMTYEEMTEAVRLANGRVKLEASGGITEETVVAVAKTGVDFISVGALTHTYSAADISLDVGESKVKL